MNSNEDARGGGGPHLVGARHLATEGGRSTRDTLITRRENGRLCAFTSTLCRCVLLLSVHAYTGLKCSRTNDARSV